MPPKRPVCDKRSPREERAAGGGPPAWVAVVVLAIAIGAVYGRALDTPFIFDDVSGIVENESIRSLWPLVGPADHRGPLNPEREMSTSGRPVVNLSLAINYWRGRLNPVGYHVFNMAIHFLATLLVWAIVRQTLRLSIFNDRFNASAGWLAFAIALLWALYPLQTEAVIYITQRSELLMALFYLVTLYCSLRYWSAETDLTQRTAWLALAVLACLAGMASKEVMVSAPLMVLLFDRTFVSSSLAKALRRSWPLYVGLASTWLLLLALNIDAPRGASAQFGVGPPLISWWMTQSQVLLMYLRLVVWPWPLLIHYQLPYLDTFAQAWLYVIPVLILAVVTLVLLWRNHPVGYLLAWVFAILLPTSVVPILTEMAAERRMYLPLAAIVVLLVVGGYMAFQWVFEQSVVGRKSALGSDQPRLLPVALVVLVAITFAFVSAGRLRAYQDPISLWREVARMQPGNVLAHANLGGLLAGSGQLPEAIAELQAAVLLEPGNSLALCNLGQALTDSGRYDKAIDTLHAALATKPDNLLALNNLGVALVRAGRSSEAVEPLEHAIRVKPGFAMAHCNLGGALSAVGKTSEAIDQFQQALDIEPDLEIAHRNLDALRSSNARAAKQTP